MRVRKILAAHRSILPYLPTDAQAYMRWYAVITSALALLDVAALMLLATSLSAMVQQRPIELPVLGVIPVSGYVWVLMVVCGLILLKSVLAVVFQWRATRRMSQFELEIGDHLFAAYIRAPWTERLKRNTSQLVRLADVGIGNVTSGFLNPYMGMPALVFTAVSVVAVIAIAQPITALVTVLYLGFVAILLYAVLSKRTVQAGRVNRDYSMRVASLMTDMVGALKEITLRGKSAEVAKVVHDNRIHTSRARANISFLSAVPRFVLDVALVGGFLLVGGTAYVMGGLANAISAVALFGVAGFRLVPSITGFQALLNQMTANLPHVEAVIRDIRDAQGYLERAERVGKESIVGTPRELELHDVSFTYPGADSPAIDAVTGTVRLGDTLGIVGSSGAGKSTIIDLLLGLIEPTDGSITLDGRPLTDVLAAWRSRVGYVPQDVALFDGTVAQNVALTWHEDIDEEKVRTVLRRAHVLDIVESRMGGIHANIGDRGMRLSGGQRQRLGIARALYSDPLVLVLDEATSSLDTATEALVTQAIRELHDDVTVISVAHRLTTVRDADEIWYMRGGAVRARGTFDEVIEQEPDFAEQARLAGLL
jgi:ATP-binding cassette subfamily C protein